MASNDDTKAPTQNGPNRRDMLKGVSVGAAAVALSAAAATPAEAQAVSAMPESPYGGGPSTGLQFPPYYRPTKYVRSRNNYFPTSETIGPDEMRISFIG